ncbi:MAG: NAD(P)/FAD-dependent oxidoreductase [Bacteroidota bacterium]
MRVLVVGYGFAGSSLSYFLCKYGIQVDIITNPIFDKSSSSTISAGIMLPFSGKRKTLSHKVSAALPFALDHYQTIQNHAKSKILYDLPVRQLLIEARDYNDWFSKTNEKETAQFIEHIHISVISEKLKSHIGFLQFSHTNAIHSAELLNAYKSTSPNCVFHSEQFNFEKLVINDTCIKYNNQKFDQVIFCDGYRVIENPYWNKLPFMPVKGEIIDIHAPDLHLDFILNGTLYVIPLGNDNYKVGATYNWNEIDEIPSSSGIQYLKSELEKMISADYDIIDHKAGVRPAIQDRRPVLGFHPQFKTIGIFNGLGTKGAMLSPYYGNMMANHIANNSAIDDEVSVDRFLKLLTVQNQ